MCVFYQQFVPGYADLADPLYNLMKKDMPWKWAREEQTAFDALRLQMLQAPVLTVPDSTKPYIVHCDASEVAMGATLSQMSAEGHLQLVACRSKKFKSAELHYPVHEKEILSLVDALRSWRHYLLGTDIQVHTDNSALSYLKRGIKPSPRVARWMETLQEYRVVILHIPGKLNVAADALSRLDLKDGALQLKPPWPYLPPAVEDEHVSPAPLSNMRVVESGTAISGRVSQSLPVGDKGYALVVGGRL